MLIHPPLARRRALRHVAWAGGAALAAAMLPACGGRAATAARDARTPGTPTGAVVMLIRHAEKPAGGAGPLGVTAEGAPSAGSLTVAGWVRAGALVGLFAPSHGDPPDGLFRPTTVWAADPRGQEGLRPQQTVSPLAARLGIAVDIRFEKGQERDLAAALLNGAGVALVAWQHGEIQAIAAQFGNVTPPPPKKWPGERFDVVWVFRRTDVGWAFSQVPQLLLAGDRADVGA